MADQLKVQCPGCRKTYFVATKNEGKTATCKSCGEKFTLHALPTKTTLAEPVDQQPAEDASSQTTDEPKGFFGRLKAAGQKAMDTAAESAREINEAKNRSVSDSGVPPHILQMRARFVGCDLLSDFGVDAKTDVYLFFADNCLVLHRQKMEGFSLKLQFEEVWRCPLLDITEIEVENAERLTMGRIGAGYLLGGPLGSVIGALWKKKDRFVRIDYTSDSSDHSIIFGVPSSLGTGKKMSADSLGQSVREAIREVRTTGESSSGRAEPEKQDAGEDIAGAIEKLAALHQQGILTDEEFATKKAELLDRL